MKTPYLYFGRKGYYAQAGVAPSSNVAALTAITIANGGMLPVEKANSVVPSTLGFRVVHRAVDAVDDARGTDYTHDFVTGISFADATAFAAAKNADDIQAGQVTNLTSASAFIVGSGNQIITIGDNTATGGTVGSDAASGITMTTNDFVYVEEFAFNAGVLPIATLGADLLVPANNLIGIESLAYTAGGGVHYDGTALDKTRLIFESGDADRSVDTVDILHTGGKFKDLCEVIAEFVNSTQYDESIKVHFLDASGQNTHEHITSRGITIFGVTITTGNRAV
jgi:hypothetical protein